MEEKGKKIKEKFRLRHTLEICYGEENSAKTRRGEKKSNLSKNILPSFYFRAYWIANSKNSPIIEKEITSFPIIGVDIYIHMGVHN